MVPVLGALGLLAVSNVALAAVADDAVPGDFLYVMDRGYEWALDRFGPNDRTRERLAESAVLEDRGDPQGAIAFLQEELAGQSADKDRLGAAIDHLTSQVDQENPAKVEGANSGEGTDSRPKPSTPAATAPGQVKDEGPGPDPSSPSDTAPGQVKGDDGTGDVPGTDPPGQNKDADEKDKGKKDPPGQTEGASNRPETPGAGNNGQAKDRP